MESSKKVPESQQTISPMMRSREAIESRIEYLKNELIDVKSKRERIRVSSGGVSKEYRSMSSKMTNIKKAIEKWELRLEEFE